MTMTGTDALNKSQKSAEAESGSILKPVKECLAWIGVAAIYNDPWATPVTGCQVRIKIDGGVVADGPRTKGLSTFGKEDGQPHEDVREELGGYRQGGVKPGSALIALVPESGDDPKAIEEQILSSLTSFEASMRDHLRLWIAEWAKDGWLSIPKAKRRGQVRGLGIWWEGEVGFWASLGDAADKAWEEIKIGVSRLAERYDDLTPLEKAGWALMPGLMASIKAVEQSLETAQALWDRRDQLMNLLKAFLEGTAAAIETALEVLVDLPGDLGTVFKDLVKQSADWVQNMIEVARETEVFKRAIKTIMTVVMMMTPNFWAEGIGLVEGYLLPEVLITIVLIIIGALCTAAGASALAMRVAGALSKIRTAVEAAGKVGKVIAILFSKIDDLARLIGNLSKALRRKVEETINGVTNSVNRVVRKAFLEKWPNKKAREILEKLDELSKKKPATKQEKNKLAQEKRVLSEKLGNEAAKNHLRNKLGKDIPDGEFKTFDGRDTVNLYYKDPSTDKVYVMEAKGGNSQFGTRVAKHGENAGQTLKQGTPEYLEDVAKQMTKNGAGNKDKIKVGNGILDAIEDKNFEYINVRGAYDPKNPLGNPIPPAVIPPPK